jgi:hypothetical protein
MGGRLTFAQEAGNAPSSILSWVPALITTSEHPRAITDGAMLNHEIGM